MVRLLFLFGLNEADLDKLLDEWNAKLPEDMCDLILEAQSEVMLKKPRGASKRKSNGIKKVSTSDEDYDYVPPDDTAVEVKLEECPPVKRRKKVKSAAGPPRKSTTTTTQACFFWPFFSLYIAQGGFC